MSTTAMRLSSRPACRHLCVSGMSVFMACSVWAGQHTASRDPSLPRSPAHQTTIREVVPTGQAESRLIEIYKLIGKGAAKEALQKAEKLTQDLPNFQLAQLVYGDLLVARTRPIVAPGDVPQTMAREAKSVLKDLREESLRRVQALQERPQPGTVPSQFLQLASGTRHAIAVDASRSRLYLFENTPTGLTLLADYYISVGKAGISKSSEGDQRTPLGVYYITSRLDPKALKDFYGSGALPISYPNVLDAKRGKTGSGIWLHGTPPTQFARPPLATDGCVVLANPDLEHVMRTVAVRSTPVVIAPQLEWVSPTRAKADGVVFAEVLQAWQRAKTSGDVQRVLSFYAADFHSNGKNLAHWTPVLRREMEKANGKTIQLKNVSFLRWTDSTETMVATFGEVLEGVRSGSTKRQYWTKDNGQWKIFYEGVI